MQPSCDSPCDRPCDPEKEFRVAKVSQEDVQKVFYIQFSDHRSICWKVSISNRMEMLVMTGRQKDPLKYGPTD